MGGLSCRLCLHAALPAGHGLSDRLIISVVIDYNELFSHANESSVRAIRDVLLVPTSDIDDDEVLELHPPAGDPPVELGRGVRLTQELVEHEAEEIMDACEPRGKDFKPTRQFGCQYAFVREFPADEYTSSYSHWDHDDALLATFTLSRLILDNAYSTEYAARLVEFADGHIQIIPGPVNLEGALAYRAHSGRDWLDAAEAAELAALLDCYWQREAQVGERIGNAIWLVEQSSRRKYDFEALLSIVAGLEALLNTGPRQNTKQFKQRVPDMARELGVSGLSRSMAGRLYEQRSIAAHGRRLRLGSPRPDDPAPNYGAPETRAIRELALVQDVLRAAVRTCIEDPVFAENFADETAVRAKWPLTDGDGNPL